MYSGSFALSFVSFALSFRLVVPHYGLKQAFSVKIVHCVAPVWGSVTQWSHVKLCRIHVDE